MSFILFLVTRVSFRRYKILKGGVQTIPLLRISCVWTFRFFTYASTLAMQQNKKLLALPEASLFVGMTGFEPAASSSRTKRATGLRYIPKMECKCKIFFELPNRNYAAPEIYFTRLLLAIGSRVSSRGKLSSVSML